MKSILAMVLALSGVFNSATGNFYQNLESMARDIPAYEIFMESDILQDVSQDETASYLHVLTAVLNIYAMQIDYNIQSYTSKNIIKMCEEFGIIEEDQISESKLNYDIPIDDLVAIISNYLRATDKFMGVTAGIKYNISNLEDISEEALYDVLTLYSLGIMSDEIYDENQEITVSDACEYIAKASNIKPKDQVILKENYLPVVMYHSVDDNAAAYDNYIIPSFVLEQDLQYLSEHGYTTLFVADLVYILENDLEFPDKPILLTFDDGYEDNYINVYRLISEYDMKAIVCPVTKHYYEYDPEALPHLTMEQTKEMQQSGYIEIANHSYDLHTNEVRYGTLRMANEDYDEYLQIILNDLDKTHNFYMENSMQEPIIYSYPYGALDDETEQIMKEYGYKATFDTDPAYLNTISTGDDLYAISRMNRPFGISTEDFFANLEMMDIK